MTIASIVAPKQTLPLQQEMANFFGRISVSKYSELQETTTYAIEICSKTSAISSGLLLTMPCVSQKGTAFSVI
jgi:hypothetical protein